MLYELTLFAVVVLLLCFAVPGFYGAPYVPTLKPYVGTALNLLDLKRGETMLELGCGDGRVVLAAARRGYHVVGYELNPCLALIAWLRTRQYRSQVTIVWGDFFKKKLPPADGVFCFIMPKFMGAIDEKVKSSQLAPIKLVSFAMPMSDRAADGQLESVYLYKYQKDLQYAK